MYIFTHIPGFLHSPNYLDTRDTFGSCMQFYLKTPNTSEINTHQLAWTRQLNATNMPPAAASYSQDIELFSVVEVRGLSVYPPSYPSGLSPSSSTLTAVLAWDYHGNTYRSKECVREKERMTHRGSLFHRRGSPLIKGCGWILIKTHSELGFNAECFG